MRELVLLFSPSGAEQERALRRALAPLKIPVRTAAPSAFGQCVGRLAGDKTLPEAPEVPGAELPEPMLVLAGLSGGRLDLALAALRKAGARVDCKAVLTPANRTWTVRQLYDELAEEHRRLHGQP